MGPTVRPRFKVCCIASLAEAYLAIDAGASALGLVSSMPSGPGVLADDRIAAIAARVPPGVDTFLLTALRDPDAIVEQHRAAGTSALQLVDELPAAAHARLRSALPGIRLVQSSTSPVPRASSGPDGPRSTFTPSCWTPAIPTWRSRSWAAPVAATTGPSVPGSGSDSTSPSCSPEA